MLKINEKLQNKVKLLFGIGTHLTNDTGATPVDMAIKMIRCNTLPVAKSAIHLAKRFASIQII